MILPATRPIQRPPNAMLLTVDGHGALDHRSRRTLIDALRPGDLVVANDAATLPASLQGIHSPSGQRIEVRLAARRSLDRDDVHEFAAVLFGEGDFRVRTEERVAGPQVAPGDHLELGPLSGRVLELKGHPRLILLRFDGAPDEIWAGLARHGRPIQYAHIREPLLLWDVWTAIAGPPVAFEPPSAGFALDWGMLSAMRARHVRFVTLTHAAGISSTGDPELDARLPFDEPYEIPDATALAVNQASNDHRRVVAVGTTVVRALEHSAVHDTQGHVRAGTGVADQRIGASTELHVVSAILTGVHDPQTTHYQLLRAFTDDLTLARVTGELSAHDYHNHEFGDSVLIERSRATS